MRFDTEEPKNKIFQRRLKFSIVNAQVKKLTQITNDKHKLYSTKYISIVSQM